MESIRSEANPGSGLKSDRVCLGSQRKGKGSRHMQAWKYKIKSAFRRHSWMSWPDSLAGGSCLHRMYTDLSVCVSVCVISFWHYFLPGISVFLFFCSQDYISYWAKRAHWESFFMVIRLKRKKKWKVHWIRQGDGWYPDKTGWLLATSGTWMFGVFKQNHHSTAECLSVSSSYK